MKLNKVANRVAHTLSSVEVTRAEPIQSHLIRAELNPSEPIRSEPILNNTTQTNRADLAERSLNEPQDTARVTAASRLPASQLRASPTFHGPLPR